MELYEQHYKLNEILQKQARVFPRPVLWNLNPEKMLDEALDRLAQEGTMFSSRNPASGHGILLQVLLYYQDMLGYEFNLIPDLVWVRLMDMLGVSLGGAQYPILEVEFTRIPDYPRDVFVPIGTEVFSTYSRDRILITSEALSLPVGQETGTVKARLNTTGALERSPEDAEYTYTRPISGVRSVRHTRVLFPGRSEETLSDGMLRSRQELQSLGRAVTARDYYLLCKRLGATKVGVFREVDLSKLGGSYGDILSLSVYPSALSSLIQTEFSKEDYRTVGHRIVVVPAEVVEMSGVVTIRAVPGVNDPYGLAWSAVNEKVNPPAGVWGDPELGKTISVAIENKTGFYATASVELTQTVGGTPYEEMDIKPWMLFQIQRQNLSFVFI